MSDNEGSDYGNNVPITKPEKKDRHRSVIWERFTVVDKKAQIAACNVCDKKLSFKTTVTNLKKHIERKHSYDVSKNRILFHQKERRTFVERKPKLSDLGGLEGLILNVVGDEGETEHQEDQVIYTEGVEEVHDYCAVDDNHEEATTNKERRANKPHQSTHVEQNERRKRNRMMDLQIECLEIKKYNMQMEALLLEQQLNLSRSIFTETLRYADTQTRSTQTDVGGSETRVFYVTDSRGGRGTRQLFAFQELE